MDLLLVLATIFILGALALLLVAYLLESPGGCLTFWALVAFLALMGWC